MKAKFITFVLLVAFVMLGSVRFLDVKDISKEGLALHVNVDNRKNIHSEDDVTVRFLIMDTPYFGSSSRLNLHGNDISSQTIVADAYDIQPGEYMAKVYVYSKDSRRVRYVPLTIG